MTSNKTMNRSKLSFYLSILLFTLFTAALFVFSANTTYAGSTLTWDNGGSDTGWETANNWSPNKSPTSGSKVVFNSTTVANATVSSTLTVDQLEMKSGYTGMVTQSETLTINNGATITGGKFNANTGTIHEGLLTLNGSGATYQAGSDTQYLRGGLDISKGTFNQESAILENTSGGTDNFRMSGGEFIGSSNLADHINIADQFILTGGTMTSTAATFYVKKAIDIRGGTFNDNDGKVFMRVNATAVTSSGATFYNFETNANSLDINDDLDINNNFIFNQDNKTVNLNGNNINVAGDWNSNSKTYTFNASGGTVIFDGSGTQNISTNGASFGSLQVDQNSANDTVQMQDELNVSSTLTVTNGTFDAKGNTSTVEGLTKLNGSGATYLAGAKPQNFNSGLTLEAGTYNGETAPTNISGDSLTFSGGTMTSTNSTTLSISNEALVEIQSNGKSSDLFSANILEAVNNQPASTTEVNFNYDTILQNLENNEIHFKKDTLLQVSNSTSQDFTQLDLKNNNFLQDSLNNSAGADFSNYQGPQQADCELIADGDSDGDNEYDSVQTALNKATSGNTLCLRDGTYNEAIEINTPVTLVSFNGPSNVKIDGGNNKTAAQVNEVDNVTIKGITVTNGGDANGESYGVRAELESNNFTLQDSIIKNITKEARASGVVLSAQFGSPQNPNIDTLKNAIIKNNKFKNMAATSLTPGNDSNWSGGSQSKAKAIALNGDVRSSTIQNNTILDIGNSTTDNANAFYFNEDNNSEGPENFVVNYNDVNNIVTGGDDYNNVIFLGNYSDLGDNHKLRFNNLVNDDFSHFLAENFGYSSGTDDILDAQYNYWGSLNGPTDEQINDGVDVSNFLGSQHTSFVNSTSNMDPKSSLLFGIGGVLV